MPLPGPDPAPADKHALLRGAALRLGLGVLQISGATTATALLFREGPTPRCVWIVIATTLVTFSSRLLFRTRTLPRWTR